MQIDSRVSLCELERLFHDLDPLALQDIGERRVVLEVNMVEFRNQLAFAPVPIMKQRSNDSPRLEPGIETDAVEQLEGGRMVGARARNLFEEIILAQGLDQCDLNAFLRERQ